MCKKLTPLVMGDLEIKVPIILGGMGVQISTAPLVGAVANCGGAGTIASVGLGQNVHGSDIDFVKDSREGLERQIDEARKVTKGAIGVNILAALTNYEDLARTSARKNVDYIISGAGLPLKLPEYVGDSKVKLLPIVSSAKAADLIIRTWKKRYDRLPDAIVVEGPLAGGHLAFKPEDLLDNKKNSLEDIVASVLKTVKEYEEKFNAKIPVIAAGGIFDGKDIAKFIKMGVSGVQMATRFVTTVECDVPESLKQLYIKASEKDIVIINSPVGLPGRAINTKLIDKVKSGEKIKIRCYYKCLKTCDARTAPYCIAEALLNAVRGNLDEAVVFCGQNVSKIKEIVSVKELIDELVEETNTELNKK
jgi:nitronate monooxygenase